MGFLRSLSFNAAMLQAASCAVDRLLVGLSAGALRGQPLFTASSPGASQELPKSRNFPGAFRELSGNCPGTFMLVAKEEFRG